MASVIVVIALAVATVLRRRRHLPVLTASAGVPDQVHRADFSRPESPWLYVLFSSATCESCPAAAVALEQVAAGDVAVDEVEYSARRDLHVRYGIEAVPLTVLADADGTVRDHFVGRTSPEQLIRALDQARASED